jgi:MYXO-CTERM domain-containing protein
VPTRAQLAARIVVLVVVAVATVLFGAPEPASACSCAGFTDEQALAGHDAAFTGTLVEVITPPGDNFSTSDPERFVFEVDDVVKGTVFTRQSVVTARSGASCGLEISGPGTYLVFASEDAVRMSGALDGELYSNLCSGTRALAGGVLPASFGDTSDPLPGASPIGDGGSGAGVSAVQVVAIVAGIALLGAGYVFGIRRRRQFAS